METPYQDLSAMLESLAQVKDINQCFKNDYTLLQLEVAEFLDHRAKGLIMGAECHEIEHQLVQKIDELAQQAQRATSPPDESPPPQEKVRKRINRAPLQPPTRTERELELDGGFMEEATDLEGLDLEEMVEEAAESGTLPAEPLAPMAPGAPIIEAPGIERILFLGASPMDRPRVSLGRQVREISESLKRARLREHFDFMFFQAVTPKMFQRHLLDQEVIPRYVHFAGFAVENDPQLGSGLIMENDEGGTQLVPENSLPQLFALFEPVDCLLINAAFSGAAAHASAEVVEFVVGIDGDWNDKAAILFATGFYDALGAGRSIEDAVNFGRNALLMEGIDGAAELAAQPFLIVK